MFTQKLTLASVVAITLFSGTLAQGVLAKDRDDRPGPCPENVDRALTLPRCLRALVRSPEFERFSQEIPAVRDGRIDPALFHDRIILSRISPTEVRSEGQPEADLARDFFESDGRTVRRIDSAELRQLSELPPREVPSRSVDRDFGLAETTNLPAQPPPKPFLVPNSGFQLPPPNPNDLDVASFLDDLHAVLANSAHGYAMEMRQNGSTIAVHQWHWARNPVPGDFPASGWTPDRRMHIASMSKFMTAIGLMHLLENTPGVDVDDPIWPWLPAYWDRTAGANELVTFADLMEHRSGYITGGSSAEWSTMKAEVNAGPSVTPGTSFDYENMNFGLIRILMATIGGYMDPEWSTGSEFWTDLFWNKYTAEAYADYMRTYVFNPVSATPTLHHDTQTALAYRRDGSTPGWQVKDMTYEPGGYGWRMTIGEILDVLRAFRTGQLVSFGTAAEILVESYGLNTPVGGAQTAAGPVYLKPGLWRDSEDANDGRAEQGVLMLLPDNIELVVFVNSYVGPGPASLQSLMFTLYDNNIVDTTP